MEQGKMKLNGVSIPLYNRLYIPRQEYHHQNAGYLQGSRGLVDKERCIDEC
jgi:hypothetical protein